MGLSDYPYNFQNLFEGCSVGQSERYSDDSILRLHVEEAGDNEHAG